LGSIAIGASTVAAARAAIEELAGSTDRTFNVNVFCHPRARRDHAREAAWTRHFAPVLEEFGARPPAQLSEIYGTFVDDDEMLGMLLETRPPVVSFHSGLPPQDRIDALHAAGIVTIATATNLAEARRIEQAGVAAIVAQGIEAGGHRGQFDPASHDPGLSA